MAQRSTLSVYRIKRGILKSLFNPIFGDVCYTSVYLGERDA